MNVPRKLLLLLGFLLVLPIIVFAGRDGHVSLVRNTDKCAGSCETVYRICGGSETLRLDAADGYFTFKSSNNPSLRINDLFSEGRNIQYWINDTALSICDVGSNITGFCDKEYYRVLMPYDKTIIPTECIKLRVTGQFDKKVVSWVDNVLNLRVGGTLYDYTEFIVWNASNITARYEFNSTIGDPSGNFTDSSGNNNNMSMKGVFPGTFNTSVFVTGNASVQLGGGSSEYLNKSAPTGMVLGNNNFSVAVWFRTSDTISAAQTVRGIFGIGDTTNGVNFKNTGVNYVNETGAYTLRAVGRGYSVNTAAIVINASQWNSLVITYNSSDKDMRMYLNGDQVAQGILGTALDLCEGTNDGACVIYLGQATNVASGNEWVGQFDDYRIITDVLNSTQIRNYHNGSSGWGLLSLDGDNASGGGSSTNLVPNFTIAPAITPSTIRSNSSLNCSFTPFDDINSSIYANISWLHNGAYNNSFDNRVLCTNSSTCYPSRLVTGNLGVWSNWSCSVALDEGSGSTLLNYTNSSIGVVQNYQPKIQRVAFFNVTGVLGVSFRVQADIDVGGNDNDLLDVNFSYNKLYYPMTLNNNWSVLVNTTASTVTGAFNWNITVRDSFSNSTSLIIQTRTVNLTDDVRNITRSRQISLPPIAFANNNYSVAIIDSVVVSNGNLLSRSVVQNHSLLYSNFTILQVINSSGNNISFNYNSSGFINWSSAFTANSSQVFNVSYNVTAIELTPVWQNCTPSSNTTGKCILTMNITNRLPFIIDDLTVRFDDDLLPFFSKKSGDLRIFFNIINGSGGGSYMNNLVTSSSGINRNFTNYDWSNATACQGEYCVQGESQGGEVTNSVIWGLATSSLNNFSVSLNSTVINGSEITNYVLGSVTTTQDVGGLSVYQYQVVYDYDTQISDPIFIQGGGGGGSTIIRELGNFSAGVTSIDDVWLYWGTPKDKVISVVPNRIVSRCVVEGFDSCVVAGEKVMFTVPAKMLSDKFFDSLSGSLTVFSESGDVAKIPILIRTYNPLGVYELKSSIPDPTGLFFTAGGVRLWWVILLLGVLLFVFFKV